MKKVLHILTTPMSKEGITTVTLGYLKNIDKSKFELHFLATNRVSNWVTGEIENYGGTLYKLQIRNRNPIKYLIRLRKLIKNNSYDIVHIHGNSGTMFVDLLASLLAGTKVRIVHTHSNNTNYKVIHYLFKPFLSLLSTYRIACSDDAGKWAFMNNFFVLNNGIFTKDFLFKEEIRIEYREKLEIENNIVLGHIGHFSPVKNQRFLIDIMEKIISFDKKYKLLLIGDGKEKKELETIVREKQLCENIEFLGIRNDVPFLLQSMDYFLFPSLFEGLGIALIEAQASGLKCISSNRVPKETRLTNNVEYLPIDDVDIWVNTILGATSNIRDRKIYSNIIKSKGFDSNDVIKKLEDIYLLNYK